MPVPFTCPSCEYRAQAPTSRAGKQIVCPQCRKALTVPVVALPVAVPLASPPPVSTGSTRLPAPLPPEPEPVISFSCPTCSASLEQPKTAAGRKILCPRCGQKLQVPQPPMQKTVLGVLGKPETPNPVQGQEADILILSEVPQLPGSCSKCGSTDTQRASAIYAAGTTHSSSTFSVSSYGSYVGGYHHGTAQGTSQTHLAGKAAPPGKRTGVIMLFLSGLFLGFLGTAILLLALTRFGILLDVPGFLVPLHELILRCLAGLTFSHNNPGLQNFFTSLAGNYRPWSVCFYAALGLAFLTLPFGIRNTLWNLFEYPGCLSRWQRTWYCHRCGTFFDGQ